MQDAELSERLDRLEAGFDAVVTGLSRMTDTLAVHGEMLAKILEAATAETPDSGLVDALKAIGEALNEQTEILGSIGERLDGLPDEIAEAVGPG